MTYSCSRCLSVFSSRHTLRRVHHSWFCSSCYVLNRQDRRKVLKSTLSLKPKVFRSSKDLVDNFVTIPSGSVVVLDERPSKPFLNFSLSSVERQFLFSKYYRQGFSSDECSSFVQRDVSFLNDLKVRLRRDLSLKKISEFDADSYFKEEFSKLLRKK